MHVLVGLASSVLALRVYWPRVSSTVALHAHCMLYLMGWGVQHIVMYSQVIQSCACWLTHGDRLLRTDRYIAL
jgi:hypothetical protein